MTGLAHLLDVLMFVVACLLILAGYPVAFTLAGTAVAFAALGWSLDLFNPTFLAAIPQRIFGVMTNTILIAIPLFVFKGVMLEKSKVAILLIETMGRLFGRLRGGLGYSVTIVGALLAASTGMVGATVVMMGLLALPAMLRWGYSPRLAAGSIAAAGTLGQILPPAIVLVVLGDVLGNAYQKAQTDLGNFAPDTVSVPDLFAGALIPGLVLSGLYILYQVLVAIFDPKSSPAAPEELGRVTFGEVMSALVPPIALILCVLGSILAGIATPSEAASVGAVGTVLLAGQRQSPKKAWIFVVGWAALAGLVVLASTVDMRLGRSVVATRQTVAMIGAGLLVAVLIVSIAIASWETWKKGVLVPVMRATTEITAMVFAIVIGAAFFSLVFRGLGGEDLVSSYLTSLPGGALGATAVVMVAMFVLGFFVDYIEICYIVVPIAAPVLLKMPMPDGSGMSPVWLGVLMGVNLQTSFMHPPFGVALFYLRGVAPKEVKTIDIYIGIIPFVCIQLAMLWVLWQWPHLATWLPHLIYGGQ
ncbi:TRAP transporter large permease subunit [Siculibacillus lacustris]|uniref:TRAP transporter large permease subunit n=1 Tax=Siculibacillus lacustris TaxID=1549641 RepID=A0A4Q9VYZ2_9HYPH|nr:TRAP transporter large permease subunit [Siculibacillus lacustris]TBW40771.1 TRAP transporter large permease subunit [Siculibacillus lacustris]